MDGASKKNMERNPVQTLVCWTFILSEHTCFKS